MTPWANKPALQRGATTTWSNCSRCPELEARLGAGPTRRGESDHHALTDGRRPDVRPKTTQSRACWTTRELAPILLRILSIADALFPGINCAAKISNGEIWADNPRTATRCVRPYSRTAQRDRPWRGPGCCKRVRGIGYQLAGSPDGRLTAQPCRRHLAVFGAGGQPDPRHRGIPVTLTWSAGSSARPECRTSMTRSMATTQQSVPERTATIRAFVVDTGNANAGVPHQWLNWETGQHQLSLEGIPYQAAVRRIGKQRFVGEQYDVSGLQRRRSMDLPCCWRSASCSSPRYRHCRDAGLPRASLRRSPNW